MQPMVLRALLIVSLAALAAAPDALAQTGQQKYTQWCQGCHNFPGNNYNGVLNGKDWNVIRLAIETKLAMRTELRPAYLAGLLTDADLMLIAGYLQTFAGGVTPPPPAAQVPVVEYYNAGFGHYFMTADADEIAGLDAGAYNFAFVRTGRVFNAYSSPAAGTVPVCRFFTVTFAPKSSHFYTADPVECEGVKLNPNWQYEKVAFHIAVPSGGACPFGTTPIYRMYNNGQTGAPNHRFTSDFPTYQDFTTTQNWATEGTGFCSPP
ncbi:hypothetical protein BURK1_03249 [Burkholderiales bacterium]|nr:hypothetical protein BURK1_03249 [Burkholderiales bacterium]